MANFNLKVKGNVKSDDDFRIQLELLQPTCSETDTVVSISSATKVKSNGQVVKAYVIPRNPSNFPGGSVDFSAFAAQVPSNQYLKALITINSVDGIDVYFGTPAATAALATEPTSLSYHIALVTLHKVGSTLQNITNADIVDRRPLNQINGAPVFYAAGDEIATEQYLVQLADSFVGLPNSIDNSIDFSTNQAALSQYASPNLITAKYSTRAGTVTGNTSVSLAAAPSFSIRVNCWARVGSTYRRITAVTNQQTFTVAAPGFSNGAATVTVCEPIPTKDLYQSVGDATQGTRVVDNFSQNVDSVLLDYDDSATYDDNSYDGGSPNVVALISTTSVDDYMTALRPTSKAGNLVETVMPTPAQNLKLVFLPYINVGDGQVNLLGYSCFFLKDAEQYRGGIFNQAMGFTNQASGLNCSFSIYNNRTLITFKNNFPSYVPGVNPNTPYGDIIVQEQGSEVPRKTPGVTDDTLPYYEEFSPNQILLWDNLSSAFNRRMISAVRRYGTIDTSDSNRAFITNFQQKGSTVLYSVTHSGCSVGDIVRWNGSAFVKAQANTLSNSDISGVIVNINGSIGDVILTGRIDNVFSGLVVGNEYYLSQASAGAIVTPKPTSGILVRLGYAISSTTLVLDIKKFYDTPLADVIVGSPTQVSYGQATHTGLQAAHDALSAAGGKILILPGTYTGTYTFTKPVSIEGYGIGSIIDGAITFGAGSSYSGMVGVKVTDSITASVDSIALRRVWIDATKTVTSGTSVYTVSSADYFDMHLSTNNVLVMSKASTSSSVFAPIEFSVNGPYSAGGSTQTEVMVYRIPKACKIKSATLFIKTAGSGGTLQVDVEYSTNSGASWATIFSTPPSAAAASGSYFTASNAVVTGGSLTVAAGTILRMNINSIQSGSAEGFILQLDYEVT